MPTRPDVANTAAHDQAIFGPTGNHIPTRPDVANTAAHDQVIFGTTGNHIAAGAPSAYNSAHMLHPDAVDRRNLVSEHTVPRRAKAGACASVMKTTLQIWM